MPALAMCVCTTSGLSRRISRTMLRQRHQVVERADLAAERGQQDRLDGVRAGEVEHVALVRRRRAGHQRRAEDGAVVERARQQDGVDGRAADIEPRDRAQHANRRRHAGYSTGRQFVSRFELTTTATARVTSRSRAALRLRLHPSRAPGRSPSPCGFLIVGRAGAATPSASISAVALERLLGLIVASLLAIAASVGLRRIERPTGLAGRHCRRRAAGRRVGHLGHRPRRLPRHARRATRRRLSTRSSGWST